MCGPKFCAMKITQEIKGLDAKQIDKIKEIQIEMDKKSAEFLQNDSEIYLKEGA
jgi:phosphomethylpyrimidine synthase